MVRVKSVPKKRTPKSELIPQRWQNHKKRSTVASRKIRKMLKSTKFAIPKRSFQYLVREIALGINDQIRCTKTAIEVLQIAAEAYLIELFVDSNLVAARLGRQTIDHMDMLVARRLCCHRK